jgi:hypothetical protein
MQERLAGCAIEDLKKGDKLKKIRVSGVFNG